jgi:hypothetical protein
MNLIERVKNLPGPLLCLHVASKAIIGFGFGIVLAKYLEGFGWSIVILGVILSIPPIIKILK